MAGGVFATQIIWPYFIERPLFYKYRLEQAPTYVTKIENITVQENTILEQLIEKNKMSVIGVRTKTKAGKILEGSGVILTSDGIMVTLAELVPQGENFIFFVDGETPSYQILKRDTKNNLALVKIEGKNLPTIGLGNLNDTKLGTRVFLIAAGLKNNNLLKTTNEGVVKSIYDNFIQTSIIEDKNCGGSPLFNIKGEMVGLNIVSENGGVSAILAEEIRKFAGF
jgi:S1-C subfamily serine protease